MTSFYILLLNLCLNWTLIGIIWFAQFVHYPLLKHVGEEKAEHFFSANRNKTGILISPLKYGELFSSMILIFSFRFDPLLPYVIAAFCLCILVWLSTFLLQAPCHAKLLKKYKVETVNHLIRSNWIRTILWTAKGLLMVWIIIAYSCYSSILPFSSSPYATKPEQNQETVSATTQTDS